MLPKKQKASLASIAQMLAVRKQFLHIVRVIDEEMAEDGGSYQLLVELVQNSHECMVNCTFDPHLYGPAKKNDLWIAGFAQGDLNNGFLLQKLANLEDKIHPKARQDETVLSSRPKKRINISNDPRAQLTEPAVLGEQLRLWLVTLTEQVISLANSYNSHSHVSHGSPTPAQTAVQATLNTLKTQQRTAQWLSDLLFLQEKNLTNSPPKDTDPSSET